MGGKLVKLERRADYGCVSECREFFDQELGVYGGWVGGWASRRSPERKQDLIVGNKVIFGKNIPSAPRSRILSRLMRNRRLTPAGGCVLFVDEPEVNLHPKAIVLFAEMLHEFAQSGIQVFLTTHSYVLLKRLEQLARKGGTDYALLDLRRQEGGGVAGNVTKLADGLPQNPIVEEALRLFELDVQLDLGK